MHYCYARMKSKASHYTQTQPIPSFPTQMPAFMVMWTQMAASSLSHSPNLSGFLEEKKRKKNECVDPQNNTVK